METPKSNFSGGRSMTASPTLIDHQYDTKGRSHSFDSLDIPELEKGLLRAAMTRKKEEFSWLVLISCIVIVAITQGEVQRQFEHRHSHSALL
jgi:hypothetical protein